jgi:hypothetical protein
VPKTVLVVTIIVLAGLEPHDLSSQVLGVGGGTVRAGSSQHDGTRQGRLFGARLTLALSPQLAVQVGTDYAEHRLPEQFVGSLGPSVIQLLAHENSYVVLPVLMKVSPLTNVRVSPHVILGPAFGFNVGCVARTLLFSINSFGQTQPTGETEVDCENDLIGSSATTLQIDVRAGLGADVRLSERFIAVLDVTYSAALTRIFGRSAAKSRATLIRVGLAFPIS